MKIFRTEGGRSQSLYKEIARGILSHFRAISLRHRKIPRTSGELVHPLSCKNVHSVVVAYRYACAKTKCLSLGTQH